MQFLSFFFALIICIAAVPIKDSPTNNKLCVGADCDKGVKIETINEKNCVGADCGKGTNVQIPAVTTTSNCVGAECGKGTNVEIPTTTTTSNCVGGDCGKGKGANVQVPAVTATNNCVGADCGKGTNVQVPAVATTSNCVGADCKVEGQKVVTNKQDTVAQVIQFISELAHPLSSEESKAIHDIVSVGEELISEVTGKANKIHESLQLENLIQTNSELYGISSDGSINIDTVANQMTSVLSNLASPSNPLTDEEKNVLHSLIRGFAQVFTPTTTKDIQSDFEKMTDDVNKKIANVVGHHDHLLDTQTLLSVFTNSDESGLNTKLISDLADTFLSTFEKQFEKVSESVKEKKD